ncbi:MAG: 4Fe-4S dicluster domain-containing protein [Verrucomicrobiae bacterium]|nr:4Fe-4S dicluster domain-containing protein [Verrucomicrobiae bacterium]
MKLDRTIRLEGDRDPNFARQVMAIPGCERLKDCIQCGTCSGVCPLSLYMDHGPRQVMALARAGFREEALRSRTLWLCASCYACTTECPRQIRITDILYELKQRAIREGLAPRTLPTPTLAREFAAMVSRRGRVTESELVMRLYWKTDWLAALGNWRLGLGLMKRGRFPLRPERAAGAAELRRMLEDRGEAEEGTKEVARS